ncbi:hypothetical protein ACFWPH_06130 [Nocardia sp. NPDC058499]
MLISSIGAAVLAFVFLTRANTDSGAITAETPKAPTPEPVA